MKGIILASGSGTRLYPVTKVISKQLLPVYDKPLIYYPLSVLMLAKIKNILILTTSYDIKSFKLLLGDGSKFGINLEYQIQDEENSLSEAFIISESFIDNDSVCMIRGDNIFYGQGFIKILSEASKLKTGALIWGYKVKKPTYFEVIEVDEKGEVKSIEEKPAKPKSDYAITGLYFFDKELISLVKSIEFSKKRELEISSIINQYLKKEKLSVKFFSKGFAWLEVGTHENLIEAGKFVQTIEYRQGFKIACLEEISYRNRWIKKEKLLLLSEDYANNNYGKYLKSILLDD